MKFTSHLTCSHKYWTDHLKKGDCAIDATCGNGYDSLFLANIILSKTEGELFLLDIQEKAIEQTKKRLQNSIPDLYHRIYFFCVSHENFSIIKNIKPIALIVYNLGYLPGADKTVTTKAKTTLQSIQSAMNLVQDKGAISITCYPGHPEGETEEKAILEFVSSLDPKEWTICYHRWINRQKSPTLLWMQKHLKQ